MPTKKVQATFDNDELEVVNTWLGGMKLFHNGELIGHTKQFLAIKTDWPVIAKKIKIKSKERLVEVFVQAIMSVKIQLQVDGIKVAGDDFKIARLDF